MSHLDSLDCEPGERRRDVRAGEFNGLDYLEVSDDQHRLTVYLLGKAPQGLKKENVRLSGGRRIRSVQVTALEVIRAASPDQDDRLLVKVDRPGDASTYTLCLVDLDEQGRPTADPFPGFDRRYFCLDFSFKAGCASDLDCKTPEICPPEPRLEPEISYLAKDYASFRQLLLDRLALLMPGWKERHVPDIGIALVELLAYTGDYLSYYQDAVATEAYLDTARQRISVRRHARLVDYPMHEGCNARAWICLWTDQERELEPETFTFITGKGLPLDGRVVSQEDLIYIPAGQYEVFEPVLEDPAAVIRLYPAHNRIPFYTWGDGDCCLERGATSATLLDAWKPAPLPDDPAQSFSPKQEPQPPEPAPLERELRLQPGDVLIFEEVLGPKTGSPADANPNHRHAVRLTRVEPDIDPLYNQPVVEIEWDPADALPFPLCLSSTSQAPECEPLEDVSVACGNVILVDHGRRVPDEDLGCVPSAGSEEFCPDPCRPAEIRVRAGKYAPRLKEPHLVFSQPLTPAAPAAGLLRQDPRQSLPWIRLASQDDPQCNPQKPPEDMPEPPPGETSNTPAGDSFPWTPRYDLLGSSPDEAHYVAEMDDERRAHLRFGAGGLGRSPEAGMRFRATYRVGQALAGNVGAEAISHIVFTQRLSGADLRPRNPLPARGGTGPEPVAQVKLFAPDAFRRELARAIIPDDYAQIVMRDSPSRVQRAAAALRWTGSWYEVLVAVDPLGEEFDSGEGSELLEEITAGLYPYRRIGHDLSVQPVRYVPLDLQMTVCVKPDYLRGQVKAALLNTFSNRRQPDGSLGFFHADRLTSGRGVFLSELVAAAYRIPGVDNVKVTVLQRQFAGDNGEIAAGALPLGPLEVARLDNDPTFPENGRLVLDMRGGR